jgi:hypothetical protein
MGGKDITVACMSKCLNYSVVATFGLGVFFFFSCQLETCLTYVINNVFTLGNDNFLMIRSCWFRRLEYQIGDNVSYDTYKNEVCESLERSANCDLRL